MGQYYNFQPQKLKIFGWGNKGNDFASFLVAVNLYCNTCILYGIFGEIVYRYYNVSSFRHNNSKTLPLSPFFGFALILLHKTTKGSKKSRSPCSP